jgi:aminoglycoside phosphotransferase family enzyme
MSTTPATKGRSCVTLDDKVAFLKRPESYPEGPERVETVETHMSWVFLTDRFAYKLKKPVRYPFLDFSTLGARRRDCQEEVRLNRRLAGDVYVGIVALTADSDGNLQLGGDGETFDWLVEMRRLPARRMLDQVIGSRAVRKTDIRRVAKKLAEFYKGSRPVEIEPCEYRQRFQVDVAANLRELVTPEYRLSGATAKRVAAAQLELLGCEPELFAERVRDGRIIEAHGDLRAEHICLGPEPLIIDCLEFNRDFRILDPVDELAFLALDCERLGAPWTGPPATDRRKDCCISTPAIVPVFGPRSRSGTCASPTFAGRPNGAAWRGHTFASPMSMPANFGDPAPRRTEWEYGEFREAAARQGRE